MKILVIHGPNLNLLGTREPEIYGKHSLAEIDAMIVAYGREHGVDVSSVQTNHEGDIIDHIQSSEREKVDAIVLNPGAYTHTSLAIADAIRAVKTPVIEVHLSNLHARGAERARSVTATACRGIISGFGVNSYLFGVDAARRLSRPTRAPGRAARTIKRTRKPGRRPR